MKRIVLVLMLAACGGEDYSGTYTANGKLIAWTNPNEFHETEIPDSSLTLAWEGDKLIDKGSCRIEYAGAGAILVGKATTCAAKAPTGCTGTTQIKQARLTFRDGSLPSEMFTLGETSFQCAGEAPPNIFFTSTLFIRKISP